MLKVGELYRSILPLHLRIDVENVWFLFTTIGRGSCFIVLDVFESVHNNTNYVHYQILTEVGVFKTYPLDSDLFVIQC